MLETIRVEESFGAHTKSINARGKVTSAEKEYLVFNAADEDAALGAVLETAPKYLGSIPLEEIEIDEQIDDNLFRVIASYEKSSSSSKNEEEEEPEEEPEEEKTEETVEPQLSFNCGNGTRHVAEAYSQKQIFGDEPAGNLVGWNGEYGENAQVDGVDVPFPSFHEKYSIPMKVSALTTEYRRKVGSLVGKVNSTKFKGWEPGEVMFESISFTAPLQGEKEILVEFDFAIQLNEKNVKCGDILVKEKKGFEYIWFIPGTLKKESKGEIKPIAGYIAQVVQYADFSVLGLGS